MLTMNLLKPYAVTEFNNYITDEFAREYFEQCFDLWEDSPSKFDAVSAAYKIYIKRHITNIDAAIQRADIILKTNFTKQTSSNNTAAVTETVQTDAATTDTQQNAQLKKQSIVYPDGYIQAPDTAYIKAEEINAANEITTTGANTGTAEKDATSSETGAINEIDIISKADILKTYNDSFNIIELCVFNMVDGLETGEL